MTSAIFVWQALRNFATDMANVENVKEIVGTREAAAVATDRVRRGGGDRVRRGVGDRVRRGGGDRVRRGGDNRRRDGGDGW